MKPDLAASPRISRAQAKENTHRALIDAAERCFLKLGYQGATLDSIAEEAGFTKGAVYWHFRNKEALFLELLEDGMRRNAAEAARFIERMPDDPDRLGEQLGAWFDRFDKNSAVPLLGLELDFESRRTPAFAAQLVEIVARQRVAVSDLLGRYFAIVGREPPMPLKDLAATLITLAKAVALERQAGYSATMSPATVARLLLGMPPAR